MPKLLIICDVYPPSFAPRMVYLVKYLKNYDWSADIVTRELDSDESFKSLLGDDKVIRVKGINVPLKTFKEKVYRLLSLKQVYRRNAKLISTEILTNLKSKDYELILCSTAHRTFLLEAASQVAKSWNKPWIADLRDLFEQKSKISKQKNSIAQSIINSFEHRFLKFTIKNRNEKLRIADALITISPWHVSQIKKYNSQSFLIYNGYDPDSYFPRKVSNMKSFNVTYTGTVHAGRHDPTLLFEAIKRLYERDIINKDNFRVQFYVPSQWRKNIINNESYSAVSEFIHFFDYVDTSEVPELLNNSAVLLLLSNLLHADGPKGLISTTKYFEYLAVERPILCVKSDEDLLEDSINESNAGIAARNIEETYDFLLKKWNEWMDKGHTTIKINSEYKQQFSRKLQAKQFVDLFNKITNS